MTDLLPPHGTMTAEQLEGFRIACACFATWGRQIEGNAVALAVTEPPMQPVNRMRDRALFLQDCAHALYLTLGEGRMPAPMPSLLPPARAAG